MKKILLFLFLPLISAATFAQKTFDATTFAAIMDRYQKDPVKFLKTEAAPDFVLAGSDGISNDLAKTISVYDRITPITRRYENVTERQYGHTGIATGITTHNYISKATGRPLSYLKIIFFVLP